MKKVLNIAKSYISKKISRKIIISVTIIIFLIIIFVDYTIFGSAKKIIHRQTQRYIEDILSQTAKNIELRLKNISDLIFYVQIDPTVQRNMDRIYSEDNNEFERNLIESELRDVLYLSILYNDEIEAAKIILRNNNIMSVSKTVREHSRKLINEDQIYNEKGGQVWFGTDERTNSIVIGAAINSLRTQLPLGYIIVYVKEDYIKNIYKNLEFSSSGEVFIINNNGNVISDIDNRFINMQLNDSYIERIIEDDDDGFFINKDGENKYYIAYNYIDRQKWFLVTRLPVAIYRQSKKLLYATIFFSAIAVMMSITAILFITRRILHPINMLNLSIKKFGDGDLNAHCEAKTHDEIGELSISYNSMVDKINDLIQKVYKQTLLKQQAELESLRMQINPHFFYNTLDTINWMARINGVDEVGDVAKAMGDLMRLTISGSEFITIEKEIKSIKNYIKIQKHRFGDNLNIKIKVDTDVENLYIPKLIIQPILENALIHGIAEKKDKKLGKVSIVATLEHDLVNILVEDNGVGISKEQLLKIRSHQLLTQDNKIDIGIHNVDKRIKLYFGSQYGIQIDSEVDVGTKVRIVFPVSE